MFSIWKTMRRERGECRGETAPRQPPPPRRPSRTSGLISIGCQAMAAGRRRAGKKAGCASGTTMFPATALTQPPTAVDAAVRSRPPASYIEGAGWPTRRRGGRSRARPTCGGRARAEGPRRGRGAAVGVGEPRGGGSSARAVTGPRALPDPASRFLRGSGARRGGPRPTLRRCGESARSGGDKVVAAAAASGPARPGPAAISPPRGRAALPAGASGSPSARAAGGCPGLAAARHPVTEGSGSWHRHRPSPRALLVLEACARGCVPARCPGVGPALCVRGVKNIDGFDTQHKQQILILKISA